MPGLKETIEKLGVTRSKDTPMVAGLKLEDSDPAEPEVDAPFRSLVGHLMWLANQTRPGILSAVRTVARYCSSPKLLHWEAALHILQYIRFTSGFGITFQRGTVGGVNLELYVDADFASQTTKRKSVSGAVVMCSGACVSCISRVHTSVTLSSTEAEYVAMALGFKEGIFLRFLWSFIFPHRQIGATLVREDNQGAKSCFTSTGTL